MDRTIQLTSTNTPEEFKNGKITGHWDLCLKFFKKNTCLSSGYYFQKAWFSKCFLSKRKPKTGHVLDQLNLKHGQTFLWRPNWTQLMASSDLGCPRNFLSIYFPKWTANTPVMADAISFPESSFPLTSGRKTRALRATIAGFHTVRVWV